MPEKLPQSVRDQRHLNIPDDVHEPFKALCQVQGSTIAHEVRTMMRAKLADYRVFYAPLTDEPGAARVAWFECEEHNDVHLLGKDLAPFGCTPDKSRADRLEKLALAGNR